MLSETLNLRMVDTGDGRTLLASELAATRASKELVMAFDEMVRDGRATVLLTDDERVCIRVQSEPSDVAVFLLTPEGLERVEHYRCHGPGRH